MGLLYLINLLIQVLLEIASFLFGSRAAQSLWWGIEQGSTFMVYLENRDPFLYSLLLRNVIPAKEQFEAAESRCSELQSEKQEVSAQHEAAMATLRAAQPAVEQEIRGGAKAISAMMRQGYRVLEEGRQRFLLRQARNEQKTMLYAVSAGLGVLNFLALMQLMGLSFHRLTPVTLVLIPLGLYFSVSVMVAVHLGLLKFVSATRNYRVDASRPVIDNLFPYGLMDRAIWVSIAIVFGDSLFSSVGLMLSLPPGQREELFWRLAIWAISSFASLVNVLLTWGIALEVMHMDFRFRHEGAVQQREITELESVISTALVTKDRLAQLKAQIRKAEVVKRKQERAAHRAYRSWFAQFRKIQREDRLLVLEAKLMAQRQIGGRSISRLDGVRKEPSLPPFIETNRQDTDRWTP